MLNKKEKSTKSVKERLFKLYLKDAIIISITFLLIILSDNFSLGGILTILISFLALVFLLDWKMAFSKHKYFTDYDKVKAFHKAFNYKSSVYPKPMPISDLRVRNSFVFEELVEGVYGTVHNKEAFENEIELIKKTIDKVKEDTIAKNKNNEVLTSDSDVLIAQVDAMIDAKYFIEGNFDIMGVNPNPIFDIVHEANMGKLDENGKPIIRESDGKILKPENWERDFAPEGRIENEIFKQSEEVKLDDIIN